MKLPACVLMEALETLCSWQLVTDDMEKTYGFPRQFDGERSPAGHVLIMPAGGMGAAVKGSLAVFTSPEAEPPESMPALIPMTAVSPAAAENAAAAVFDRLEAWDEELAGLAPDLSGVRQMIAVTAAAMDGSMTLIDESYNTPASAGPLSAFYNVTVQGAVRPSDESIADLADDPQITAVRYLRGVHLYESPGDTRWGGKVLFRNLFRLGEDHYFNRLLFTRPSEAFTATDRFMLEHLARRIEPITRNLSTFSMPVSRYAALQRLILSAAEPGFDPSDGISTALSPLDWEREDRCRMMVLRSLYERRDPGISEYILRRLEQLIPGSCGAVNGDQLLLAMNVRRCGIPFRELRSRLAEFLRENMYKAGISGETASFYQLRGAYLQAAAAMELGSLRDPMFWYYLFEDYLGDYLLRKATEEIPADMLILPAVETLRRHDALRGTRFVETLGVFARENFNVTHAANSLYIHRTSFQDRMDRIRALTGLDTDDEETRFLLQFSFRLLKSGTK